MTSIRAIVVIGALAVFSTSGCDKGTEDATEAAPADSIAKSEKSATKKRRKRKRGVKADRGSASMKIGDTLWEAKRVGAAVKSRGVLRIDASRMDMVGKKASRQQLILTLPDYKGPGTYQVRPGSMFIGVGIDKEDLKKADTDKKAGDVATKAVTSAKTILLMKTTVVVESADDKEVVGSFSQPALGKYPALTDGKFRAILKK